MSIEFCMECCALRHELPKTGDDKIIVFPEDETTNTTFTLETTIR